MNTYLISYDLNAPEFRRDYETLFAYIKKGFTYWAKPLQSVWIVNSPKSVSVIRDELKNLVDSGDKVLVIQVKRNWATYGVTSNVTGWMKKNVQP